MHGLPFTGHRDAPFTVLCLGAHADDIEIGCGGTVLQLIDTFPQISVHWVVFSATPEREAEARASARLFLGAAAEPSVDVKTFRDGYFPFQGADIKSYFEDLKSQVAPDLIFTHYRDDRHQDHRLIADLTWNTFRDHLILEYEIPKYDGDWGRPNVYVPLDEATCDRKIGYLQQSFASQHEKPWYSRDTFTAVLRLRGIEARVSFAEAFHGRKLLLCSQPFRPPAFSSSAQNHHVGA